MNSFTNSPERVDQLMINRKTRNMNTYVVTENEINYISKFSNIHRWSNDIFNMCVATVITLGQEAFLNPPSTAIANGIVWVGLSASIIGILLTWKYRKESNDAICSIERVIKDESK